MDINSTLSAVSPGLGAASLIGGTLFRLSIPAAIDKVSSYLDHRMELQRMRLQEEIEDNEHRRRLQALRVQTLMGVTTIETAPVYDHVAAEDHQFKAAVEAVKPVLTNPKIELYNAAIRPTMAACCLITWGYGILHPGVLTEWDQGLIGTCLGVFIGSRISGKQNN